MHMGELSNIVFLMNVLFVHIPGTMNNIATILGICFLVANLETHGYSLKPHGIALEQVDEKCPKCQHPQLEYYTMQVLTPAAEPCTDFSVRSNFFLNSTTRE